MTTFIQPPFWAQGRARWLQRDGAAHVAMQFVLEEPPVPVVEPITLEDAKLYLRVTVPDEDAVIARLITAARVFCERRTSRPFVRQVADVFYDSLGMTQWITLPVAPVQAVTSVTITDLSGVATVVDPATYRVDLASEPPRIGLPTMGFWPWPQQGFQGVAIRVVLGYPVLPDDLAQAVYLLVGHYYENRDAIQATTRIRDIPLPFGVEELLASYELVMVA